MTEPTEPDIRWSLANERTLLAYSRTALSLLLAGLAVVGSHTVTDAPVWLAALGVPLIVLGAVVALAARRRFFTTEAVMRAGGPLPLPSAASLLPWGIAAVGAAGLVAAFVVLA
ncbi:MAG TPA: DUF202 domain-containing protein [Acidimicrobiales bacterium]|nr:DUF202 domain-containing protein [Acidimicrobiales bacterium]